MDREMNYGKDYQFIPTTSVKSGKGIDVLPDLYCYTVQIVNVVLVKSSNGFVLIDAGMPNSSRIIIKAIEDKFGKESRPNAIILTHGHFDHVGAIIELVEHWNVPVYAHQEEIPFLTGRKSYPEPDTSVEGGMVAKMSRFFPNEPINLGENIHPLPEDGTVPYLKEFRWIHTPGHTPGHVSFFRDLDRALIAGDAFVTVHQENLFDVFTQHKEISGPPRYLTTDWEAAKHSVESLTKLKPRIAITGHGLPMSGGELNENLEKLDENFDDIAVPDYGRYVQRKKH